MADVNKPLTGISVLAALNGLELFGHELGNIEVFKILRSEGAEVIVGVNKAPHNHVKVELHRLMFQTFDLPFGCQWSKKWIRKSPLIALSNLLAVFRCSWAFKSMMNRFRPTHIHLGSPLVYSYLAVALGVSKVPLVYRMGDCPPSDSPFNLHLWRMAVRRSSQVVSISEYVRLSAIRMGAHNASVVYNLAPTRSGIVTSIKKKYPNKSRTSIVYVGAVAEHKGLLVLVEAFSRLHRDHPNLCLDVVGGSRYDSSFRDHLISLLRIRNVEGSVNLRGHVVDPSSFYRNAAIHVAPSICEEALGNVVLEAKREGTPSVIFPSGGLPELVRHQVDGYICKDMTVEALEKGLRWMLSDADRLVRMGIAAFQDSDLRFGGERFAQGWVNVYKRS